MNARQILVTVASGLLFGLGLAVSTMLSPEVVLSFLEFRDAGLLLVMGGAMGLALLAYQWGPRRLRQPWLGGAFDRRQARLDRDTLLGAALFGVGWGLSGVCPGPAIASLGAGNIEGWPALLGIVVGAWLQGVWAARRAR